MQPGNLVRMESSYFGCREGVGLVMKVSHHFEHVHGGFPRSVTYVTVKWNSDTTTIEEDTELVVVSK